MDEIMAQKVEEANLEIFRPINQCYGTSPIPVLCWVAERNAGAKMCLQKSIVLIFVLMWK